MQDTKAKLRADFEQLQREYKNMEAMRKVPRVSMPLASPRAFFRGAAAPSLSCSAGDSVGRRAPAADPSARALLRWFRWRCA
jgi:hypothetical protein